MDNLTNDNPSTFVVLTMDRVAPECDPHVDSCTDYSNLEDLKNDLTEFPFTNGEWVEVWSYDGSEWTKVPFEMPTATAETTAPAETSETTAAPA